jgi:hypothetical protein
MAIEVTARDLADLGDQRFEQLVASIVFAEEPHAERPATPDGGADVLVPSSGESPARVWQVKHYPDRIAWKKCESSLDDAIAAYDPSDVVFVFPRNLSKPQRETFETRLARRAPDVGVRLWGLTHIQEKLAAHPEIATRYFGEDRDDLLAGVLRAVKQGGEPLETTRDLADRAFALDAFAETKDPSFTYEYSFGSATAADRAWQDVTPFMVVHDIRGERRVSAEAWLRPEAQANASMAFTADEDGARARAAVREGHAAGEPVRLTSGFVLLVDNTPVVAKELYDAAQEEGYEHEGSTISPGDSFDLTIRLGTSDDAEQRAFAVRHIPPTSGSQVALGAVGGGLALFADFVLAAPPKVQVNLQLSLWPGRDPSENATAARFLINYLSADTVVCVAEDILPAGGLTVSGADIRPDDSMRDQLKLTATFFDGVALIEQHLGPIDAPYPFSRQDYEEVLVVAAALGTRTGTFTCTELSIDLPPNQVDTFVASAEAGHRGRHPLRLPLFGKRLDVGIAEFDTPPIRFVFKEPSKEPGKTRVVLRTEPVSVPFRLVTEEPRAPARPSRLWTPGQGPTGLVHLE